MDEPAFLVPSASNARGKNWVEIILVVGQVFFISLGAGLLMFFSPKVFQIFFTEGGAWPFVLQFAQEIFLLGLTWYIIGLRGECWRDFCGPCRKKDVMIGLLLCLALWICFSLSSFFMYMHAPWINKTGQASGIQIAWKPSFGLFVFCLVNPLYEEGLFRGFFQTRWRQLGVPIWAGALLSALMQTSYHIYYGLGSCLSLFFGFQIWALYYARTGRLWPIIFAHLFADLVPLLLF